MNFTEDGTRNDKPRPNGRCHECGCDVDGRKVYCGNCKRDRKALADLYRRGMI